MRLELKANIAHKLRGSALAVGAGRVARAAEAIEAMALAYRAFAHAHPGLYSAGLRAADPEDSALLEVQAEVVEIALRVLAATQSDRDEAIHTVRIWRSMLHGFVALETNSGFGLPQDIDETFRRLVLLMIQATREETTDEYLVV